MAIEGSNPEGVHSVLVSLVDVCVWIANYLCDELLAAEWLNLS